MIQKNAFLNQLGTVFSAHGALGDLQLETILAAIPGIKDLRREPFRSTVLVRFDLDVPIKNGKVADMSRIEAGSGTIKYCTDMGWKVVLLGHVGRDAAAGAEPVCSAMSEYLGIPISFVADWLDERDLRLKDGVCAAVHDGAPGSVFMLQNARKYVVERALWDAEEEDMPRLSDTFYPIVSDIRLNLTDTEINESIAASNLDFSSTVIPLGMRNTAMGLFMDSEMKIHIPGVRRSRLVVFSGLKMDKLTDLEAILLTRTLDVVLVGGALAMPLKKAAAELAGGRFSAGRVESDASLRAYIKPERLDQARRIVEGCLRREVDLVLPVDFVTEAGEVVEQIPSDVVQMDIGPRTIALFSEKIHDYIAQSRHSSDQSVMFFNGAFGKFEDARFEAGTRAFIPLLRAMTDAGFRTYVGGGEGRSALLKYGSLADVTHAFTAGGTVLKCLANRHLGYLKAMYLQNTAPTVDP